MHLISSVRGGQRALASAAVLLLALCLLAGSAQASYTPGTPRFVAGDVLEITATNQTDRVVVAQVDTTSLSTPYYTTYGVVLNEGRWEIPSYWHHDDRVDEQNLVENLQARRVGHVDPVLVVITDQTITGGDMQYTGLSLAEAMAGKVYPIEPAPGESGMSPLYVVGDILGNVSDRSGGAVVSAVSDRDDGWWYGTYLDTARHGDRWAIEKFYNGDMSFGEEMLAQNDLRRVAHADPHTVVVNDTTTSTGDMGWYRLSLAEVIAGKIYDLELWQDPPGTAEAPRYLVGDILGNDTSAARSIVAAVTVPASGYPVYTTYPVTKSGTGWEIPKYWHGDYQLDALQVYNQGLHRVDHTDPHFAVVTDPAITAVDLVYAGLSLGELLEGTPGYPPEEEAPGQIGGDIGYFLVSTAPSGAEIYLEDISGTRYPRGNTTAGPLNVSVYLTATPVRAIVASLPGYRNASFAVTQYPAKGGTLPVSLTLEPAGTGTQPYKPHPVPGRIEAEDYDLGGEGVAYHDTTAGNAGGAYRHDDVDIETGNGITNVGWIRDGEHLLYTVTVAETGDYAVAARIATPNTGCRIRFSVDGQEGTVLSLPRTGSFGTYATATRVYYTWSPHYPIDPYVTATPTPQATGWGPSEHPLRLTAGTHALKLEFSGDGQNLDWFELAPYSEPTTPPTPTAGPYRNVTLPATIQAEDYDLGGEGVAYHDTTPANEGGAYRRDGVDIETGNGVTDVGWIRNGEWMTYTANVTTAGTFTMTARVASPNTGRIMALIVDHSFLTSIGIPNTGSFATFRTVEVPVALAAGRHTIKLSFFGDGQNIDWIAFAATPGPTPTSAPYVNITLPATIQAEDYDLGGEDVAYHDTTPGNSGGAYRQDDVDVATIPGGHAVVGIEDGEWLTYTISGMPLEGNDLAGLVLYLGSDRDGGRVRIEVNGQVVGNVSVPNTGSATTFRAVQTQVVPTKGTLRLVFRGGGMGMDRIVSQWVILHPEEFPHPNFTADRTNGTAPLTVRFTDTSSEFAYDWRWTFGDGGTSTEQNPVHTFLSPGVYPVNLTIREHDHYVGGAFVHYWDPIPAYSTKTVNVTVEGTGPGSGHTIPGTIQAEDYDAGGDGVSVASLPGGGQAVVGIDDGEYLTYTIGDISPTPELPALILYLGSDRDGGSVEIEVNGRIAGNVSVPNTGSPTAFRAVQTQVQAAKGTLRLVFHGSGTGMDRIVSPVFVSWADGYATPNFTVDRTNGTAPLSVHFTDTSSEWAYEWAWDFGDGAASAEQNPVHTFQRPGVYDVTLTIKESGRWSGGTILNIWNNPSHRKTVQVTVEGTGPTAGLAIPGTIQAEDYNTGGEGAAYHDTTPGNSGGAYRHDDVDIEAANGVTNVGWVRSGEWLAYTATVATAGNYTVTARVASPNAGRAAHLSVDGVQVVTIPIPNTGSFTAYRDVSPHLYVGGPRQTPTVAATPVEVSAPIALTAGTHTLRLTFAGDGQNIDWIAFAPAGTVTSPTPTPTPGAGGASFTAAPNPAAKGTAVKFTLVPATGKRIASAWWSFDATAHLNTWNSRTLNPTFYYPAKGTFSPLVKIAYTDGTTETVQRTGYIRAT